jgi:acyl carrier protein
VIEKLRESGTLVQALQADVSQRAEVARLLAEGTEAFGPLRGIVHAAGAIDDAAIAGQTWDRLATACSAKVWGSWWLHELTLELPLDFFLLFSSGASLVGSAGQANHAAANAFLDALAHGRRASGLQGQSVNWGAWASIGIAAEIGLSHAGLGAITPEQGLTALEALLSPGGEAVQLGVMAVDWGRALATFPPGTEPRALLELGSEAAGGEAARAGESAEAQLLDRLATAPAGRASRVLEEHVRLCSAQVLGLDAARLTDIDRPLVELGLDSLMAIELRNVLGRDAGQVLPATLVFEYPTIRTVAAYLEERLGLASPGDADAAETETTSFDDLSTQEIAALLAERLDRIS